jgi:HEAT repeat protein
MRYRTAAKNCITIIMQARTTFNLITACVGLLVFPTSVLAQASPQAVLAKLLRDRQTADLTLLTLRATGDKELLPYMEALAKSGDSRLRQFAVACLADIGGKDATSTLADRFLHDSDNAVRIEALVALLRLETIPPDPLRDALKNNDENVRCVAARAMVKAGQFDDARPVLRELIKSNDLPTAAMSRMSLLAAGNADMLEPLRRLVRDPATEPTLVALLIEQAMEQRIQAAMPLLEDALAATHLDAVMDARAFRALSAIDPAAGARIGKAIADSDNRAFQCLMMRVLSERADAAAVLGRLAKEKGLPGVLARLELARREETFKGLADPLAEATALGHPVVVEYVLDCARTDAAKNPQAADVYTPALLTFIGSVSRNETRMTREHIAAALAVTWLVDLGSPQAVEGVKKLVAGRYDAVLRLTAAGLSKAQPSARACDLAAPLLRSPFPEVQQEAAMTLGRNGDKRATAVLTELVVDPNTDPRQQARAAWHLLRVQGKTTQAVAELAKQVR